MQTEAEHIHNIAHFCTFVVLKNRSKKKIYTNVTFSFKEFHLYLKLKKIYSNNSSSIKIIYDQLCTSCTFAPVLIKPTWNKKQRRFSTMQWNKVHIIFLSIFRNNVWAKDRETMCKVASVFDWLAYSMHAFARFKL